MKKTSCLVLAAFLSAVYIEILPAEAAEVSEAAKTEVRQWLSSDANFRFSRTVGEGARVLAARRTAMALFDADAGRKITERTVPGGYCLFHDSAFSPDGRLAAVVMGALKGAEIVNWIELLDTATLNPLDKIAGGGIPYFYHNDGLFLRADPAILEFWKIRNDRLERVKTEEVSGAVKLSEPKITRDGRRLLICAESQIHPPSSPAGRAEDCVGIFRGLPPPAYGAFCQVWDLEKMEPLGEKIGGDVNVSEAWEVLLSPDEMHAVVLLGGGERKTRSIALIDMETGKVSMPELPRRNTTFKDVGFSQDGNTLTAEDETGTAVSWKVSSGTLLP